MNLVTTLEIDGLNVKGELLATREEFYFAVHSITEAATGRTFASLAEANAALDLALDEEMLENLAAKQAGI